MAIAALLISVILDEALTIQLKLLKQYDVTARTGTFDMPAEMKLTRGFLVMGINRKGSFKKKKTIDFNMQFSIKLQLEKQSSKIS